jgi:DNA-binding response OmpR family regulator
MRHLLCVLIVEDEPEIGEEASRMIETLRGAGYRLTAQRPHPVY